MILPRINHQIPYPMVNRIFRIRAPTIPVNGGVSFQIGDTIYYGLGMIPYHFDYITKDFYKSGDGYNWKKIAPFPEQASGRRDAVAFVLNGKAYVGTGLCPATTTESAHYCKDFWCYDAKTDRWTEAPDFIGEARDGAIAFSLSVKSEKNDGTSQEMAFVGCGASSKDTYYNDFYGFDGTKWKKVNIPAIGSKRYQGSVFIIQNVAYICGGYKYYDPVFPGGDFELATDMVYYQGYPYDQWGILKEGFNSFNLLPRAAASTLVLKKQGELKGYIACGISKMYGDVFYNNTCWEFDPSTKQWSKISSLSQEIELRTNAISFTLQNKGYIAFGEGPSSVVPQIICYHFTNY